MRRAIARGLLGDELPPLVGGIQRYEPVRLDLLVRDATCAAAARAKNADSVAASHPESARDDLRRIRALIRQSRNALPRARKNGELSPEIQAAISVGLDAAEANASIAGLARVADALTPVCGLFK